MGTFNSCNSEDWRFRMADAIGLVFLYIADVLVQLSCLKYSFKIPPTARNVAVSKRDRMEVKIDE